jgi:hypothetical protein
VTTRVTTTEAKATRRQPPGALVGDLRAVGEAGHGDAEIAEIVAHVALNVFTNYFNRCARTSIDF